VAVERAVAIVVAVAVVAVVVEMTVDVARLVMVAVDRAFETATAAVEDTGNNQPNYHIVVGGIDPSSSSSFVHALCFLPPLRLLPLLRHWSRRQCIWRF
jgi:hypothetical protein